jgi:DNA-binding NarL/FixJ family response regulator
MSDMVFALASKRFLSAPSTVVASHCEPQQKQSSIQKTLPFRLTEREAAVLAVLFTSPGATYKYVAEQLKIPFNTLKSRVKSIYNKLAVDTQFEALQLLQEQGFTAQDFTWALPSANLPIS